MANHAYAKTGKKLNVKEVDAHIRRIVAEKFKEAFIVEYNPEEKLWLIHYPKDDYMGFQCWISDETEYGHMKGEEFIEYKKPKLISKGSVIEFRHGHSYQFMWWAEGVVRETLGQIYNARMFDDGCEINPKPKAERYSTFENFCRIKDDGTLKEKKFVKETKKHYLPKWQKLPKEVVEKLQLDFKVK